MNDEQLTRLFASLDEPAAPDADFADGLFDRLQHEQLARRRGMPHGWLWLAAALLLAAAIGSAIAVGSGRFQLPIVLASPSAQPSPSTSDAERAFRLAYIADGDVYLADWDGADPVRIAESGDGECGTFNVEGPMWSPDGRFLAYRGGCWGDVPGHPATVAAAIHISDAQGRPVTSFPGEGWQVRWSPDSTRIATWDSFMQTVAIYTLDGDLEAHLTLPADITTEWLLGDYDPVWSPDGTSLLFPPFEVPVDGSDIRHLPDDDPLSHYGAVPSPDGSQVAYIIFGRLAVANADGTDPRTLVPSTAPGRPFWFGLAWSAAGDKIAFANVTDTDGPGNEVQVVDLLTGSVITVPTDDDVDGEYPMRFSPDGDQLLFIGEGRGLMRADTDGSDVENVVAGYGDWQPLTLEASHP